MQTLGVRSDKYQLSDSATLHLVLEATPSLYRIHGANCGLQSQFQ